MTPPDTQSPRDHLFISYASEDGAFAEWLALRLTAEGYKVWIDRFKLLGGESYPEDIDRALKQRTFRVLALLSDHSITKENPRKERTIALNLQRDRGEELLIPLNVDGLGPTELDWMTSDITFIPFWDSWAKGLEQLLEKLEKVKAPKGAEDGREIAARAYFPADVVSEEPESLFANLLQFERIPKAISCYTYDQELTPAVRNVLADEWAFWALPPEPGGDRATTLYYSFEPPPSESSVVSQSWTRLTRASWRDVSHIKGVWSRSIIKPLLRRSLLHHLRQKGMRPTPNDPTVLYFPPGLVRNDRIGFEWPDGRSSHRKVVGERSYQGRDRFRYHQAVTFDIETDLQPEFAARFRIRLHITDTDGEPLDSVPANARRNSMTWSWYNKEWLARHLAVASFAAGGDNHIEIGTSDPVIVSACLVHLRATSSINEKAIPKGTTKFQTSQTDNDNRDDNSETENDAR